MIKLSEETIRLPFGRLQVFSEPGIDPGYKSRFEPISCFF
jgi:hypothetical protein